MKSKRIIFGFILVLGLLLAGPQVASAAWSTAHIDQIGQDYGNSILILTDNGGVFENKWFVLRSANKKEMLAVALTALAMGKDIRIEIDADGITINRIRVHND